MNDPFQQRLRESARALPVPDAPADLIDRVIAERAAGARVDIMAAKPSRVTRYAALAVAVAALIVAAVVLVPSNVDRASSSGEFSSTGLFVRPAYAEQSPSRPDAPPLATLGTVDFGPRHYAFTVSYVDSLERITPDGGGTVTIAPMSQGGTPAWHVVLAAEQTIDDQRRRAAETLVVARQGLRPLERAVHVRPYLRYSSLDIRQRFAADSVYVDMRTDGGVHRVATRRLPREYGPFISDAIAPLALMGQRLDAATRASVSVLGWAVVPRDVFFPVTLRVIGDERIRTSSGVFDCWKIDVSTGRDHRIEWVRKSDGLGLRSIDTRQTPRGARRFDLLDP